MTLEEFFVAHQAVNETGGKLVVLGGFRFRYRLKLLGEFRVDFQSAVQIVVGFFDFPHFAVDFAAPQPDLGVLGIDANGIAEAPD